MKRIILCFAIVIAAAVLSGCTATKMTSVPNGFIGSVDMAAQEPFEALLENDQWIITGKQSPYLEQMSIVLQRFTGKVLWVTPVINYNVPTGP